MGFFDFIGKLGSKILSPVKKIGEFVGNKILPTVGKILPTVGAIGKLIPHPIGQMIGHGADAVGRVLPTVEKIGQGIGLFNKQ